LTENDEKFYTHEDIKTMKFYSDLLFSIENFRKKSITGDQGRRQKNFQGGGGNEKKD